MNKALFRAFLDKVTKYNEFMSYFGLTTTSEDVEVRKKIFNYLPTEFINLPRLVFENSVKGQPNPDVPFLRDKTIRIICYTSDQTMILNESILNKINNLIEEETLPIKQTDNVNYWTCFEYVGEGTIPLVVSDVYAYFYEYKISASLRKNKVLENL